MADQKEALVKFNPGTGVRTLNSLHEAEAFFTQEAHFWEALRNPRSENTWAKSIIQIQQRFPEAGLNAIAQLKLRNQLSNREQIRNALSDVFDAATTSQSHYVFSENPLANQVKHLLSNHNLYAALVLLGSLQNNPTLKEESSVNLLNVGVILEAAAEISRFSSTSNQIEKLEDSLKENAERVLKVENSVSTIAATVTEGLKQRLPDYNSVENIKASLNDLLQSAQAELLEAKSSLIAANEEAKKAVALSVESANAEISNLQQSHQIIMEAAESKVKALTDAVQQNTDLNLAYSFWDAETSDLQQAIWAQYALFLFLMLGLSLGGGYLYYEFLKSAVTLNGIDKIPLALVAPIVVGAAFIGWGLLQLSRIINSNIAARRDARMRGAFTRNYLELVAKPHAQVGDEERRFVFKQLFTTSESKHDDDALPGLAAIVKAVYDRFSTDKKG